MGIQYRFVDNAVYSEKDVQDAFRCLTRQDVDVFTDTGAVLEDLNDAVSVLISAGVETSSPEACKLIREGSVYKLMPGTLFLQNGMTVVIDEEGQEINILQGTHCYVYATETDNGPFVVSETPAPEGAVALAEIDADGIVTDTRMFAAEKIEGAGGNNYFTIRNISIDLDVKEETLVKTIVLPTEQFHFVYYGVIYQVSEGEKTEFIGCRAFQKRGRFLDIYVERGASSVYTADLTIL